MTEYILRLIAEGKNLKDDLEMRVDGTVPRIGDTFTLEKEYPACIVTYRVTSVSPMNIKVPKNPLMDSIYQPDTQVVSALREPGGFQRK